MDTSQWSVSMCFSMVLLWLGFVDTTSFHVEKAGINPVSEEDIGVRFFLSVTNNLMKNVVVMKAHNPDCCWTVEDNDEDCKSMVLYGGFPTEIKDRSTKNITYVFPNKYPLDRVGFCHFHLKVQDDKVAVKHEVKFNTSTTPIPGSWLEALFEGGPKVWRQCDSIDLNWRNSCYPYDCTKRYNGFRSFYNKEKKRCEPVARCHTLLDDDDKLPTSAFDFEHNDCKNLVPGALTQDVKEKASDILDAGELAKKRKEFTNVNPDDLTINCNNGKQIGTYCRCHPGWRTVAVTMGGGGVKMDWCSKKVPIIDPVSYRPSESLRVAIIVSLGVVTCSLVILLLFLWWRMFHSEFSPITSANDNDFDMKMDTTWVLGGEVFDASDSVYDTPSEDFDDSYDDS